MNRDRNRSFSNAASSLGDEIAVEPSAGVSRRIIQLEAAARAACELPAGRELTDAECKDVRDRLREFARILRAWENRSQRGKVEVLCQQDA